MTIEKLSDEIEADHRAICDALPIGADITSQTLPGRHWSLLRAQLFIALRFKRAMAKLAEWIAPEIRNQAKRNRSKRLRQPHRAFFAKPATATRGPALAFALDPHVIVVKRRTAERRDRIGAGERIDAPATGMRSVRPKPFRDQDATLYAGEIFCINRCLSAFIH